MWMLTGGALGWAGYSYLGLNHERGFLVSVIIGAAGGVIGGEMLAPLFAAPGTAADGLSSASVLFAAAVAAAALVLGNLIEKHWGV